MNNTQYIKLVTLLTIMVMIPSLIFSEESVKKINYAVLKLKNGQGVTVGETDIIGDRLRINLFRTGFANMMERSAMDQILKEQGFQQSGICSDAECAVEVGQLLGVERIIGGSIGRLGNLILVNFRVIDIQTAKIIKAVSLDITGGIEGVVSKLPGIAQSLVSNKNIEKKEAKSENVEIAKKAIKSDLVTENEVESEPVVMESSEFIPKNTKKGTKKNIKNKNRGGISLGLNYFPGVLKLYSFNEGSGNYKFSESFSQQENDINLLVDSSNYSGVNFAENCLKAYLSFIIPVGSFVTFDISPSYAYYAKEYSFRYTNNLTALWSEKRSKFTILTPNLSLGINFVKRVYPLKINVGFVVGFNFNIVKFNESYVYDPLDNTNISSKFSDRDFDYSTSFGPKIGLELMAGTHFGIGINYHFLYNRILATIDEDKFKIKLPASAIAMSINVYY